MTDTTFQRARKPAERTLRRSAILAAAAELFDADGIQGAGINAIAARAGFTKSNIYRYFESREEVLLSLLLEDFEAFTQELEASAPKLQGEPVAALAHLTTQTLLATPRMGRLLGLLATVLEENVSEATVASLKTSIGQKLHRLGAVIQAALPGSTPQDSAWAAGMIGAVITGTAPSMHPNPTVRRVLERPEFAAMRPVPDQHLERPIRAILQSIVPATNA